MTGTSAQKTSTSPKLWNATATRLPRQGPAKGGGLVQVADKAVLEALLESQPLEEDPPEGLKSPKRPITGTKQHGTRSAVVTQRTAIPSAHSGSPRSSVGDDKSGLKGKARLSPEERKRMEIASKWEKTDAQRQRDYKVLQERVEQRRDMRDARYERLLENVMGQDSLASKTAMALREGITREKHRRRELHEAWDTKVHQPLANQAYDHLNPPNRRIQQLLTGTKQVAIQLPPDKEKPKLTANVLGDPARKPVIDMAMERAFHTAAEAVLRGSRSAPDLRAGRNFGATPLVPRAMSRPTLEPTDWGQVAIQGTLFGHFAQVAEQGPGFKRSKKGGTDVHVPSESDGVLTAGTRASRANGLYDRGILRGDYASRGEASQFKHEHGTSSGAPLQDHFNFHGGKEVTDLEFPLGKRMFPEFH